MKDLDLMLLVILIALFLWSQSASGAGDDAKPRPMDEVKNSVAELKSIVSDPTLKGTAHKKERQEHIRKLIVKVMDLEDMGKRSIGRHWTKLAAAQRAEYLEVYVKFIEAYYREKVFSSVEFMNSLNIQYLKERVEGDFSEVDVKITAPDNSSYNLTFRLYFAFGHWRVYDVVMEGISTVNNWRAQFDRVITKQSFDALLTMLREKTVFFNK